MSLKQWSIINTLSAFLYFAIVQSGESTGVYAFVIIIAFGLGVLCQLVLAGLTRPAKITTRYILIVTLRALLFLSVPLLKNLALRITFVLTIPILDFLQSNLPLNRTFLTEPTETEKQRSSLFYKSIFYCGLLYGLLISEYIVTSGFVLLLSLIGILKQKPSRFRTILAIEFLFAALLRVVFYFDFISVSTYNILVRLFYAFCILIFFLYSRSLKKTDEFVG